MTLRAITCVGERQGSRPASAEMVARRAQMDAAGEAVPQDVIVTPHRDGPGRSEWVAPGQGGARGAILFLHGSGYSKGSPSSHRPVVARLVVASDMVAYVPDYRLAPEHRFPAALEDALEAYRYLLDWYDPDALAVVGDSAGGGLALSLLLAAKDEGLPLPAAAVTLSAWTDLAVTGDARPDVDDPRVTREMLRNAAALYLDGADPRDPYASPLYGDPAGFPPLLMQVGGREILIEDTRRFAERAEAAGVTVRQSVWPGVAHVFQLNQPEEPDAARAIAEIAGFVRQHIGAAR